MTSRRSSLASYLTLGLIAILGALLIFKATPDGLGLSDDSVAYIAGARSLLAGEGYRAAWLETNKPVTHFPPAFSGTLAFIGITGADPINGARLLNTLLFGVNAALLGLLGWRMTKSSVAGIILAALFVANDSLLRVHAVAMSEPLFLFFSLIAFLVFAFYFETNKPIWLIAAGILTSLAYLTRYSGLALVATFVVALILLNDTWKKRIASVAIFLASFMPLVIAWSIRNRLVAGNATNRTMVWHPVTPETLEQGLRTFSEFLIPIEEWRRELFKMPEIFIWIIVVILLAILLWILVNGLQRFFKPSTPMPEVVGFTNGLYIFGYLASVLFSISLFDASTPLKVRILAPVYLPLLLLLVNAGGWVWNRRPRVGQAIVVGLAALIFSISALGQARTVTELSKGGTGFASFKWYDSEVMDYLATLDGLAIYTNEPGAVYLYTGRGCRVLPQRVDPVTGLAWDNFDAGVEIVHNDVLSGNAILALFDVDVKDANDIALLTDGLYLIMKSGGDAVYYAPPP
ncbi:MAG: phospholipid carrier-dependent glycosyltransferase [Anaerolineaceae bacterium]|nr:MAG: phospholipid carrier-dependent glycosyltransferase [Anaerolineaceae bacterium]